MRRFPDFIIGGAMKSGTSTLHYVLSRHERIFIPSEEIHFFSRDDLFQHPRFSMGSTGPWMLCDYDISEVSLEWYGGFFSCAGPGQVVGEDSTIYLASPRAPARIAQVLPRVKMIFLLRNPVDRCYSQYWHSLMTGRLTRSFESILKENPCLLLNRSLYKEQLIRYFGLFDRSRIRVIIFEKFIKDIQGTTDGILDFLQLPRLAVKDIQAHRNAAITPRILWLQYAQNLLRLSFEGGRNPRRLSSQEGTTGKLQTLTRNVDSAVRRLNSSARPYPPIKADTRRFLEEFLARENEGLSELLGFDVSTDWPFMSRG